MKSINKNFKKKGRSMASNDKMEFEGTVVEVNKGTKFKVKLKDNNMLVDCTLSGRLRMNYIKIIQGDRVTVSISPYDLTRGIITWRYK